MGLLEDFADGLTLDFTSKAWGGNGVYRGVPSKTNRIKIRVPKEEKVKLEKTIKPQVAALAEPDDVRSLDEHRARVELYARAYARGFDPLTGADLKEVESLEYFHDDGKELRLLNEAKPVDEFKPTQKAFDPPAYSAGRNVKVTENDGLKLLTELFAKRYIDED